MLRGSRSGITEEALNERLRSEVRARSGNELLLVQMEQRHLARSGRSAPVPPPPTHMLGDAPVLQWLIARLVSPLWRCLLLFLDREQVETRWKGALPPSG